MALAQARGGDRAAFDQLVAPLWRELHAHCYRMLGSSHDADDALLDALLERGGGWPTSLRSWLHSVATRARLDAIHERGGGRCRSTSDPPAGGPWSAKLPAPPCAGSAATPTSPRGPPTRAPGRPEWRGYGASKRARTPSLDA